MFKKKPYFIVFEGIEGCGKSYQSNKLYKKLKKSGLDVISTREPGGTKSSEFIRNLILKDYFTKNTKEKFDKYTDTLLYLASRNEHVKNKIIPSLSKKKIVICDRFIDSTFAYQVYGKKVKKSFIDNIHKVILGNLKPNLTFILKVNYKSSSLRLKKRKIKNRYDKFKKSFYLNAQKAFLKISKNKKNYIVLDASLNSSQVENTIYRIVSQKIGLKWR